MNDRVHDPTPRRLRLALAQGDVPRSPLLSAGLAVLAATVAVASSLRVLRRGLIDLLASPGVTVRYDAWGIARLVLVTSVPVVALLALGVIVGASFPHGLTVRQPGPGGPPPGSAERGWGAFRAVAAALIGGALLCTIVVDAMRRGSHVAGSHSSTIRLAAELAARVGFAIGGTAAVLGALDLALLRAMWRARLRMTRAEREREQREEVPGPIVSKLRAELAVQVREAAHGAPLGAGQDVAVVGEDGAIVVLRYERARGGAPRVIARARGRRGTKLAVLVERRGVPVNDDADLAAELRAVAMGAEIPSATFDRVATFLAILAETGPITPA